MKRLGRENLIYVLEPDATPAINIESGEDLMVETWDAFEGVRDPAVLEAKSLKGPAIGPIYVNPLPLWERIEVRGITPIRAFPHRGGRG